MEVFQSYTKIKIKVIPVGLQIHTICNWHCSGQMVNLLQLFFPKNWLLSWFSFRQIICFLKPWKEFSVLYFSYLSYQCPMSSIGMVSEKPSMNVQLVKSIFFFSLSPPPHQCLPCLHTQAHSVSPFNLLIFFCPSHNLMKYVGLKHVGHSKNWGAVDTPYRCWQAMELNKSFFKSMPHQCISKQHRTYSLFFYKEGRKIIFSIIIELFGME